MRSHTGKAIIFTIIILLTFAKVSKSQPGETGWQIYTIDTISFWKEVGAIEFLDSLREHPYRIYIVKAFPDQDWYNNQLIPVLMQNVSDTSKAGCVVSGYDSFEYLNCQSSVGEQAQCLLQGIIEKRYPPKYWLWKRRYNLVPFRNRIEEKNLYPANAKDKGF